MRIIDYEIKNEFRNMKKVQIVATISILIRTVVNLIIIFLVQKLVDQIAVPLNNTKLEKDYFINLILMIFFYTIFIYISQYFLRLIFFTGNYTISNFLFKKTLGKDIQYFEKNSLGESISKITSDSILISDWMAQGKVMFFTQIFILISNMGLLMYYSFSISVSLLVLLLICFYIINILSKRMGEYTQKEQKVKGEIYQKISQTILGIYDVKQFSLEKYFSKDVEEYLFKKRLPISKKIAYFFSLYVGTSAFISKVIPILSLLVASILASKGLISIGSVIAIYSISRMLDEPIRVISDQITNRTLAVKTQDRLRSIYKNEKEFSFKGINPLVPFFEKLDININEYKYTEGSKPVVTNFKESIFKGKTYLIKGDSGAGKSTIGNLIMNQVSYKNLSGNILWNSIPIENFIEKSYYDKINKMEQNIALFDGTIKENVSLFKDYSEENILEILEIVDLKDLVKEKGLDYILENNGQNISGGQRQRLSLARILLKKPEFIILDEPTSSLNQDMSELIANNVNTYVKNNSLTMLIITHKNDFDRYADKIFYLN